MTLSEFIKKRLEEMGKNRSWLVNFGDLDWSTLSNIDKGKSIQKVTQEKLAKALQCSQGDIQACMAEQPSPFRKEAEMPEGQAGISIAPKKKKKLAIPDSVAEELAEAYQPEPEVEPEEDMMFPVETEEQLDNRITREVAEEMYKRKLKDKVGKILANTTHELTDRVRQEIGVMLLQELWGDRE